MKVDSIRIIEAAYAAVPSEESWLSGIGEHFLPFTPGLGVLVTAWDLQARAPTLRRAITVGMRDELATLFRGIYGTIARDRADLLSVLLAPHPSVACWMMAVGQRYRLFPEEEAGRMREALGRIGCQDSLGVLSRERSGATVLVSIPFARAAPVPSRTLGQLSRVTAHVCSAIRLRTRASGEDVEAWLAPSGKLLDARGSARDREARESLGVAVRKVERARGHLRRTSPEEALDLWQALFEGRWSIVEQVESDGKRMVLARRNEPGVSDPRSLTPGERDVLAYVALGHSNKYVAYLLGVTAGAVSSRLASALRKLGVCSRREAIALLGGSPATGTPARPA